MSSITVEQMQQMAQASAAAKSPFSATQTMVPITAPVSNMGNPYPAAPSFADTLPQAAPAAAPEQIAAPPEAQAPAQLMPTDHIGNAEQSLATGASAAGALGQNSRKEAIGAFDSQAKAADRAAQAEAQQARELAKPAKKLERAALNWATATKNAFTNTQKKIEAQQNAYQAAVQDAAGSQLHEYFADKSTAGKIMGVLAAALGGAANGLAGTPGAPTALDRIIDRDLQLQTAQLQQKDRNVASQGGLLQQMINTAGSEQAGRAAVFDAVKSRLEANVKSIMANNADPITQARGGQVIAGFQADRAKNLEAINATIAGQLIGTAGKDADVQTAAARLQNQLMIAQARAHGAGALDTQKAEQAQMKLNVNKHPDIPGFEYLNSVDQKALRGLHQGTTAAVDVINELHDHPNIFTDKAKRAEAVTALQKVVGAAGGRQLNPLLKSQIDAMLSATSNGTLSRYITDIGGPSDYYKVLEQTKAYVIGNLQAAVAEHTSPDGKNAMGLRPGSRFGPPAK
jgi:hypothetical protein